MEFSIEYFIDGRRPVKLVKEFSNSPDSLHVFSWETGEFFEDDENDELHYDLFYSSDTKRVSREEFEKKVKELREKIKKGQKGGQ